MNFVLKALKAEDWEPTTQDLEMIHDDEFLEENAWLLVFDPRFEHIFLRRYNSISGITNMKSFIDYTAAVKTFSDARAAESPAAAESMRKIMKKYFDRVEESEQRGSLQ